MIDVFENNDGYVPPVLTGLDGSIKFSATDVNLNLSDEDLTKVNSIRDKNGPSWDKALGRINKKTATEFNSDVDPDLSKKDQKKINKTRLNMNVLKDIHDDNIEEIKTLIEEKTARLKTHKEMYPETLPNKEKVPSFKRADAILEDDGKELLLNLTGSIEEKQKQCFDFIKKAKQAGFVATVNPSINDSELSLMKDLDSLLNKGLISNASGIPSSVKKGIQLNIKLKPEEVDFLNSYNELMYFGELSLAQVGRFILLKGIKAIKEEKD